MKSFISDKYRHSRGGWSRILAISCKSCGTFLFHYQKDGPGPLKRCYVDRILNHKPAFQKNGFISCPHCNVRLGFDEPFAEEDNRPAIRWALRAVNYKIISMSEISV